MEHYKDSAILTSLKESKEAPQWLTEQGLITLQNGYMLDGETPKDMWMRVSKTAAEKLNKLELAQKFFELFWNNWLCAATPVLSNMGTSRGLPISCNSIHVDDSIYSIFEKQTELAILSKNGAGVGIYLGDIRDRGEKVSTNGRSEGVVPWIKGYDSTTLAVSQGCYDEATELLTDNGWVHFKELKENTLVAQLNDSNKIEFVNFTDYIEYEVEEELYKFYSDDVDLLVTANHNMVVFNKGKCNLVSAENLSSNNEGFFLSSAIASNNLSTGYQSHKLENLKKSICYNSYNYIDSSFKNVNFMMKNDMISFSELSVSDLNELLDECYLWQSISYFDKNLFKTSDKLFADFIQAILTLSGKKTCLNFTNKKYTLYYDNDDVVNLISNLSFSKQKYKGKVYCVTVPSHKLVVRRNGKVVICGNSVRRGASAVYLPIDRNDSEEFINIRRPIGDMNRRCLNIHHAVCISDQFMHNLFNKDERSQFLWKETLKARFETGEPYLFFTDNVNSQRPESYVKNDLYIKTSNICNEIYLYTDPEHTFVCCLSSLNLARYDEWKNTNAIQLSIWFLDAVLSEYIDKAENIKGLEAAVRFAEKSRAVGLGALGWHTLLQRKNIEFDSFDAMQLNNEIFKLIKIEADKATRDLAKEYGEPLWCKGLGVRNTHLLAVAPTVSNSIISGSVSAGIEPISANVAFLKTAKGSFLNTNPALAKLLSSKNKNTIDVWKQINENNGSVNSLKFLTDHEKNVFLTAREINQMAIIRQAGQRQKYIDQGQSVNLFFSKDIDPKYFNRVHIEAWKAKLKGLYYCRSESVLKGDSVNRQSQEECKACEG